MQYFNFKEFDFSVVGGDQELLTSISNMIIETVDDFEFWSFFESEENGDDCDCRLKPEWESREEFENLIRTDPLRYPLPQLSPIPLPGQHGNWSVYGEFVDSVSKAFEGGSETVWWYVYNHKCHALAKYFLLPLVRKHIDPEAKWYKSRYHSWVANKDTGIVYDIYWYALGFDVSQIFYLFEEAKEMDPGDPIED